jgi:GxxExxY protein
MKHEELTRKIIGCAMKVHSTLGNGFTHKFKLFLKGIFRQVGTGCECFAVQEVIYQRCLAIELEKAGIKHKRELEMKIYYEEIEVGTRRVDFLIDDVIMTELKALTKLEDVHLA